MKKVKNVINCLTILGERREIAPVVMAKYNKVKNYFDKYFVGFKGARADAVLHKGSVRSQYRDSYLTRDIFSGSFQNSTYRQKRIVR